MKRHARFLLTPVLLVGCAALGGCSSPSTDITATTTERVGDYAIVGARTGGSMMADVCVSEPSHADAISARILQQLMSKGYRTITLNMYGPRGPIARYDWNGQGVQRQNASATERPVTCGPNSGETSARR